MDTYPAEISGDNSLKEFQLIVAAEENAGAKFVTSVIGPGDENTITNLLTFEDLPAGTRPAKPLIFREGKAPASDNFTPVWEGNLRCEGRKVFVSAYR
jgi:hypothetical protein